MYGDDRDFQRRLTRDERDFERTPPPPPGPIPVGTGGPTNKTQPPPTPAFSYTPPRYTGPSSPQIPNLPQFEVPEFVPPDYAALMNDPSYQFRLNEGERALNASAAARGVLRTGGTLRDIVNYGQSAASQESQNAYDRAVQTYGLNYNRARDQFAPQLLQYSTQAGANQSAFDNSWDRYRFGQDDEFRREQMLYNGAGG